MQLFAQSIIEILQALHGVAVFVLLVALIMGGLFLFFVSRQNWKHILVAGQTAAISYLTVFGLGLLIYPVFRVDVRAALLDKTFPQATALFEIKEHLAALAAFVAIAMLILGIFGHLRRAGISRKMVYATLASLLGLFSLALMVLGFSFTAYY